MEARYEPESIRALFDEMSATYGFVNLIASFGFAAIWRRQAVQGVPFAPDYHVVDLMSGMSELCRSIAHYAPGPVRVTGIDLSTEMIRRARKDWPFALELKLEDVLTWEFEPSSADVIVSSFGLKTFDTNQLTRLAEVVSRLLRPGGVFSFVEISVPQSPVLRLPYMFYLNRVIPLVGKICLGNPDNYRMLGIYTTAFGNCRQFAKLLQDHGLNVTEVSYFFGCATGVRGSKPA